MKPIALKQYRMAVGLSQAALAQDIGISERSLLKYESEGEAVPRYVEWYVAAKTAGLTLAAPKPATRAKKAAPSVPETV